jgi:hypothetical protein
MSEETYRDPSKFYEVDKERASQRAHMVGFRLRDAWEVCGFENEDGERCTKEYYPHRTGTSPHCADCTPKAQIKKLRKAHREQHDEIIRLRRMLNGIKELIE